MDIGSNEKISFIPKGALVHEGSFFERRRPRSIMGIIAVSMFVLSAGSYAGFYFYENFLANEVVTKTTEIEQAQQLFRSAPQVEQARIFSMRAELVKELLSAHSVVSPVFTFLSQNTIESIYYTKFSFSKSAGGSTLQLDGEAPTYAALAYQADLLRGNTTELSNFSVTNIALTNYSTVTFTFDLTFKPEFLSYEKNSMNAGTVAEPTAPGDTATTTSTSTAVRGTSVLHWKMQPVDITRLKLLLIK